MKKRYVLKNKKRFSLFIVTLSLIAMFTTFFAGNAYGYREPSYKEIIVRQGDTLWDLARKYNAGSDIREYIYKIKKVNNLASSEIYNGSKIKMPVD